MEGIGAQVCEPRLSLKDTSMTKHPFITGFTPGYMQRIMPKLAKQGDCFPWMRSENYKTDCKWLLGTSCDDGVMMFAGAAEHMGGVRERRGPTLHVKLLAAAVTAFLAILLFSLCSPSGQLVL